MACHILDPVFYSFDLGMPDWVEGEATGGSQWSYPTQSTVRYHFPAREGRPEFILTWKDGKNSKPERPDVLEDGREMANESGGTFAMGTRNIAMSNSHASMVEILPHVKHEEAMAKKGDDKLRRVKDADHFGDWFAAIRGEVKEASSHFGYSAKLNELVLLGSIAQRVPGVKLHWDEAKGAFKDNDLANHLVKSSVV
jgi:hypothetical protein